MFEHKRSNSIAVDLMTLLYDTNSPLQYGYVGQEDSFLKSFENYHCYILMVFVCMCVCMCHTEHMEVRGQLCGVSSHPLSCQIQDLTQVISLAGMHLYSLSHLADPNVVF